MAETLPILLDVISPESSLLHRMVESVELPGTMGRFMILRNHAPLISSLVGGEISYVAEGGESGAIAIKSGFVEICDNKVTACVEV